MKANLLFLIAFLALTAPAHAQDDPQADLPPICKSAGAATTGMGMGHMTSKDEAHAALMAGMESMNQEMMAGMTAKDIDVAFVCSMIPHHQGAISMAKEELRYGNYDWDRQLAQKVIDAQEKEIDSMRAWLKEATKE
jgi:uncharacterized protein (DUF305 family)